MVQVICPVCSETFESDVPDAAASVTCPQCTSSFSADGATIVDPVAGVPEVPRIAGYELLGLIARGGMGVVVRARDRRLGRLVALKIPLHHRVHEPGGRERFLREARAAAGLRHANICPVYEVGEQGGQPYIAMGLIQGRTLRDWAKAERPTPRRAAEIVEQLARAVHYAHHHNVIHRDIKPSNVIVDDETGQPVLTDFGLAKELDDERPEVTRAGQVVGTPAYMAPEQAAGRHDLIGPRTDVYALGALLYALLCDRPPFLGSTGEIIRRVQVEEATPPRKVRRRLHRDLDTICLKALAKDAADRYTSALALAEDLHRFAAGEAIRARRLGPAARAYRAVRRRPLTAAVAIAILAALAIAGYIAVRAGASRRVAALTQSFETLLDEGDWSADHLRRLDALIEDLHVLSPARAAAARDRLHTRFAQQIEAWIDQPKLEPSDVARVTAALERLAARDAPAAEELRRTLAERAPSWQPLADLRPPFENVGSAFEAGSVEVRGRGLVRAAGAGKGDAVVLTGIATARPLQVEVAFGGSWASGQRVGVVLRADDPSKGKRGGARGYQFLLCGGSRTVRDAAGKRREQDLTLAECRAANAAAALRIIRNGVTLRQQVFPAGRLDGETLVIAAERRGEVLTARVNDRDVLTFREVFPLPAADASRLGLVWPVGAEVRRVRASVRPVPPAPSPLEQGDDLYAQRRFDEALAHYRRWSSGAESRHRQESRFKEAACLIQLNRQREASRVLERLAAEEGARWPAVAACHLWMLHLLEDRVEEAEAVFDHLAARYEAAQLALQVPLALRTRILASYIRRGRTYPRLDARHVRALRRAVAITEILGWDAARQDAQWVLFRALHTVGRLEEAQRVAENMIATHPINDWFHFHLECCWVLRLQGKTAEALRRVNRWMSVRPSNPVDAHRRSRLLLERARIHAAMDRWDRAEADVDEYLRHSREQFADRRAADRLRYNEYRFYAYACLMRGFLLDRRGDSTGAVEAWRGGLIQNWLGQEDVSVRSVWSGGSGQMGLLTYAILASLTDTMSDENAEDVFQCLLGRFATAPAATVSRLMLPLPPSVFRKAWQNPRAREYARQLAFQEVPFGEFARLPTLVLGTQAMRQGAFNRPLSDDEDRLLWETVAGLYADYLAGKFSAGQVIKLLLTWKGTTGLLGWAGLAPQLPPRRRGPIAYLLGWRFLRKKKADAAKAFFRTALSDSPEGSTLRRLASSVLERLSEDERLER